jgi:hypothetical protein
MVFAGPGLPARINRGLAERMDREGIGALAEVVGRDSRRWAEMKLP